MKKTFTFASASLLTIALLLVLSLPAFAQPSVPGWDNEQVTTHYLLNGYPISLRFLPDGRLLIVEKNGKIKVADPESQVLPVSPTLFMEVPNVEHDFERGLLDVVLDPDFVTNGMFYAYYNHQYNDSTAFFRVSKFITSTGNGAGNGDATTEVMIWEDDENSFQYHAHYGGSLSFAPDGTLLLSLGEKFDQNFSQDKTKYAGSVLRINTDGTIPGDNPMVGNPFGWKEEIYAMGVRQPFRCFMEPGTGRFFIGDIGMRGINTSWEDIHVLQFPVPGNPAITPDTPLVNFGHPIHEGYTPPLSAGNYPAGFPEPVYTYPHAGTDAAVTGGFVYSGSQFPGKYSGAYIYADFFRDEIHCLFPETGGGWRDSLFAVSPNPANFFRPINRMVSLVQSPSGGIYYINYSLQEIRRINYADINNAPPTCGTPTATPTTGGGTSLVVNFNPGAPMDPDGDSIRYVWDFGDGNSSTLAAPTHTYTGIGTYSAQLQVSDGLYSVSCDQIIIRVGDLPQPGDCNTSTTNGLVASWDFSEGTGATVFDQSGVPPLMDLTIDTPTNVTWVQDGLRFDNPARAMSSTPDTKLYAQCRASNEVSVEAWVEPLAISQSNPATLVALSSRTGDRNFMVGQKNNATHGRWTVNTRTSNTPGDGGPAFDPNTWTGFSTPELMHVVYTRNTTGDEATYVNGMLVESGAATKTGTFDAAWAWQNTAYFSVGGEREDPSVPWNSPSFWQGTVYLMSVYDRAITPAEVGQNYLAGCGLPGSGDTTTIVRITSQVDTVSDDAEENINSTAVSIGSSDLELAYDGIRAQIVGIRFKNLDIPAGATVTNAYIQFTTDGIDTGAVNLTIHGEATSNAQTFASVNANISTRPRTSASVAWSPAPWLSVPVSGPGQQTADLSSIIEEIINMPGWQPNNAISILIDGTGQRTAKAYGPAATTIAPILVIDYELVGGPPNIPPMAVLDATPTSGSVALNVAFDASNSSDSDGTIVGYDWDFGDNTTGNTVSPSHLYTSPGTYIVSLTVTDDDGDIDMDFTSITVVDTSNIIQVTSSVSAKSDDAEENLNSGFVSTGSSDLELGYDGTRPQIVGMRFTQINVPPGATIASAYVQFTVDETNSGVTNLTVFGEDTDNATTFASVSNGISSRSKTSANVAWSPVAWNTVGEAGPDQQTPNIASILQEIIDRPGWQSNNALSILIEGTGERTAESYGNNPAIAAKLFINFEVPGGLPNVPPVAVLNAIPTTGSIPLPVAFDGGSSTDSDGFIAGYSWDLGDGTTNSVASFTHTYTLPGTYPVTLIVTDDDGASDTATTTITVLDTSNLVQTVSLISLESDDAEENINSGFVSITSSDLELAYDGNRAQLVGIRFNGLAIPPGATISSAYVQFTVDEPDSGPTFLNIRGQASDNAQTFQSLAYDISSRPLTSAVVNWAPAPWVAAGDAGLDQQTPNIASVIQEIVNRPGWTASSSLAIVIDGIGERTAEDHKPSVPEGPALYVTYEPSTGPSSRIANRIEAEFYPNPFQNEFHIRVKSQDVDWVDVRVVNVLGQILFEGYDFDAGELITVGAELPAGVYFVQVTSGERFEDFKVVKK